MGNEGEIVFSAETNDNSNDNSNTTHINQPEEATNTKDNMAPADNTQKDVDKDEEKGEDKNEAEYSQETKMRSQTDWTLKTKTKIMTIRNLISPTKWRR